MMVTEQDMRSALIAFISRQLSVSFVAEVISIDDAESDGYVTVRYNDMEFDVKLQAVTQVANDGLLIIPKVGSLIFCTSEGNSDNMFVATSYTAIEKFKFAWYKSKLVVDENGIQLKQGNNTLRINSNGWIFNDGSLNGLVKLNELVENLNSIKSYVEAMNSALPGAFTAIGSGSAANGANGATSYNGSMGGKNIQLKDMENDKIKQ